MIPGIASSQVSAVGTNWVATSTNNNNSTAPMTYLSAEDRYCWYNSKSQSVLYQTTAGSLTDFQGTTWSGGGTLSATNSKPSWGNGWVFFPNANSTTGIIHYGYSTSVALTTLTTILDPRAVVVHGSRFVAIGLNAATSIGTSGGTSITWVSVTSPSTGNFLGGASNGTRIVGIQASSLMKYIDGVPDKNSQWSSASTTGLSGTYNDIAYANGYWVIVGSSGLLAYSTTGIGSWTTVSAGFGTNAIRSICFYQGRWYATAKDSANLYVQVRRSTDSNPASPWVTAYAPTIATESYGIRAFPKHVIASQANPWYAL